VNKYVPVLLGATIVATLGGGGAMSADLMVNGPAAATAAPQSELRGTLEIGVLGEWANQPDDSFSGFAPGGFVTGSLWGGRDSFVWGIDGLLERNTFNTTEYEAPLYVGTLGLHLGIGDASQAVGAFAALAVASNRDEESSVGASAGVEANTTVGKWALVGQLGYAHIETDTSEPGDGFHGFFIHNGAVYSVSDDFAVMADAGIGYAPESFEDVGSDQPGVFATAGLKAAYRLPTEYNAYLTFGYEAGYYNAIEDEDVGFTHTIKVGLSLPFGANSTAANALNAHQTYTGPFRAGSWAATLD
jgi:hypothetical protein